MVIAMAALIYYLHVYFYHDPGIQDVVVVEELHKHMLRCGLMERRAPTRYWEEFNNIDLDTGNI